MEKFIFYTIEEALNAMDKMNEYWGFDKSDPLRTTYFDENSFQFDEIENYWWFPKNKWSECLK